MQTSDTVQTLTPAEWEELRSRTRRLEDRAEIQELVVRYGIALDAHDLDTLGGLYSPDGSLELKSGRVKGRGRDAVVAYYADRLLALPRANHFSHGQALEFDPTDEDRARGFVMSHVELWSEGEAKLAALRYEDEYVRLPDEGWRFRRRVEAFLYFLPLADYPHWGSDSMPVRMAGNLAPSDWTVVDAAPAT
jgi:SnoaL-like domain